MSSALRIASQSPHMSNQLLIAPCSAQAARWACLHWHYSKSMPPSGIHFGVYEQGRFIGAVIFAPGASPRLGNRFGVNVQDGTAIELVRVALTHHAAAVSKIVSIAVRLLRARMPRLRLLMSFADPIEGHHGGIYQAMGWAFLGETDKSRQFYYKDRWVHVRVVSGVMFNRPRKSDTYNLPQRDRPGKFIYALGLDAEMRGRIDTCRLPYPKRGGSRDGAAAAPQADKGGSTPTPPLQAKLALGRE